MKKYRNFLSENFHFLVVKVFSIYLNRHVFVMRTKSLKQQTVPKNSGTWKGSFFPSKLDSYIKICFAKIELKGFQNP